MKINALLVGIDHYPTDRLHQCRNDVEQFKQYLFNLSQSHDVSVNIMSLTDGQATKSNIVDAIKKLGQQSSDQDTAIFYFSGHGAREVTGGRFPSEHDGLLECLVCSPTGADQDYELLADKEVRFLLSAFNSHPHLVTIFDCCHSGDIVRGSLDSETDTKIKRIPTSFEPRPFDQFIFSSDVTEQAIQDKGFARAFPYLNHIHLSACTPEQSAWENSDGGVFTQYLLKLLDATNNQLTYRDITRWAKISMRGITKKQQTPTFSTQGYGKISASSPWLNLIDSAALSVSKPSNIYFNDKQDNGQWILDRGDILGIQKNQKIPILLDNGQTLTGIVTKTEANHAVVEFTAGLLDKTRKYAVSLPLIATIQQPEIFINDIDGIPLLKKAIHDTVEASDLVELATDRGAADYFLNIFNTTVYLSLPEREFIPLAIQLNIDGVLNDSADAIALTTQLTNDLLDQLRYVSKYHHFDHLENLDQQYDLPPVLIEGNTKDNETWMDITNQIWRLEPQGQNDHGLFYRLLNIQVTNVSNETLYVGALVLTSNFQISATPLYQQVITLQPGESQLLFYDSSAVQKMYVNLEDYMEVYNWPFEFFKVKIIYNNFENFTDALSDFEQPALDKPYLPLVEKNARSIAARGAGEFKQHISEKKWGTAFTEIRLSNPFQNLPTGILDAPRIFNDFLNDEVLGPFLYANYAEVMSDGFQITTVSKPNVFGNDDILIKERGLIPFKWKLKIGNKIENMLRLNQYKFIKSNAPHQPTILAEGDSWFCYPIFVKDIVDCVMRHYPVRSFAAAGDELQQYIGQRLIDNIEKTNPKYVILSGGGNDVIGESIQAFIAEDVAGGQLGEAYIKPEFTGKIQSLRDIYKNIFDEITTLNKKHPDGYPQKVFVHGYDYIPASDDKKVLKKGWVNKYLYKAGVKDKEDRQKAIDYLLHSFNNMLVELVAQYDDTEYIGLLEVVGMDKRRWRDEIHPNTEGFKPLGRLFVEAIDRAEAVG